MIGTAEHPLAAQPPELMGRYTQALEKVMSDLETVFTADYRPVRTWPPLYKEFRPWSNVCSRRKTTT